MNMVRQDCKACEFNVEGFLSEPSECRLMDEPHKWFTPRIGVPEWCPINREKISVSKENLIEVLENEIKFIKENFDYIHT